MHKAIKYLFNQKIRLLKHKYQSYEYFSVAMETKTIFFSWIHKIWSFIFQMI